MFNSTFIASRGKTVSSSLHAAARLTHVPQALAFMVCTYIDACGMLLTYANTCTVPESTCEKAAAMACTINVCELALGLVSPLGSFSGAQEHIRHTEHGSNRDDLVGTTAGSTQGPNQVPISTHQAKHPHNADEGCRPCNALSKALH